MISCCICCTQQSHCASYGCRDGSFCVLFAYRQIAREAGAAVRQDIFEVGEEGMAVGELAQTLAINASEVVKILFMKGLMVTVNQAR